MKQINNVRFPYPFLLEDGGDYRNSKFEIELETEVIKNIGKIEITCINYTFVCPFLEEMIAKDNAVLVLHIEQRTYRQVFPLEKGKKIQIDVSDLSPNYNLELVAMVVAKKPFSFKYQEGMNEVFSYFDGDFVCEKTSILGFSNFVEYGLMLESKTSSIFTISEYKDNNDIEKGEPYKIDLNGNTIDIKVFPTIKKQFVDLRAREISHNKLLNSVFVYPAIQVAIIEIFKNYDNYKDYKWCISIVNKLCNEKECSFDALRAGNDSIDSDELVEFTHIILEDLLISSFEDAAGEEE